MAAPIKCLNVYGRKMLVWAFHGLEKPAQGRTFSASEILAASEILDQDDDDYKQVEIDDFRAYLAEAVAYGVVTHRRTSDGQAKYGFGTMYWDQDVPNIPKSDYV